jgi:hypothetical protein
MPPSGGLFTSEQFYSENQLVPPSIKGAALITSTPSWDNQAAD